MRLPLGDGTVPVSLPDCDVTIANPPGGTAVDVRRAAEDALADPHGPPLSTLVDPDDEVAIVVTDVTRAVPDDVLVDVYLDELRNAGVDREQVTVVIGLGLHRPMTDEEIEGMLGEHAPLAENHDASAARKAGEVDGVAVEVNPTVADADLVLSTGMVEPHQYAGFSGGAKTVVVGAGGESFIRYTHGPEMLSREGVRLGRVDGVAAATDGERVERPANGNPFRDAVDRAGDAMGVEFCLNVTHGPAGILGASAGRPREVVADLAAVARDALSVSVSREYEAVVAGVGAPKDANLYQATRAATYVALGDRNPLKPGGRLVVPAELPEGAGEGTGERRFYDRLAGATDAASLYEEMREGYGAGAQRAFVVARVLRDHDVYVTNSESPDVVEDCLMHARDSVADAIEPGSTVLVVPDALHTLLVD